MTTLAGPDPPKRTLKLTGSGFRGRKRGQRVSRLLAEMASACFKSCLQALARNHFYLFRP